MKLLLFRNQCGKYINAVNNLRFSTYVQGQSPEPNTREYFYYIDHQGMLFLDDAKMKNFTSCFKEKKFLEFFFKRLKINDRKYKDEFPFLSPCGREQNYIRCEDLPIVFTHVVELTSEGKTQDFLLYNHAGDLLKYPFEPENICMLPETGRVYHPAMERVGGVGLIRSALAIEFSKFFKFIHRHSTDTPPTHFTWKGQEYQLTNIVAERLKELSSTLNMKKLS